MLNQEKTTTLSMDKRRELVILLLLYRYGEMYANKIITQLPKEDGNVKAAFSKYLGKTAVHAALDRLMAQKLVSERSSRAVTKTGEKYVDNYAITEKGIQELLMSLVELMEQ
jgi:DNA-binding PadR family transcriptional regulator